MSTPSAYQWVNTATDYDADPAKYPAYLRFDGVDDALQTGNIDFTGTDKMTVWAGVTALGMGGGTQVLAGSNADNFNGFGLYVPSVPGSIHVYHSSNSGYAIAPESGLGVTPRSMALTGVSDQAASVLKLRRDGIETAVSATFIGAASGYGNRPFFVGSLNGSIYFFNGRLYSLIVRGAQSSLSQIEATELYIKQKMRLP